MALSDAKAQDIERMLGWQYFLLKLERRGVHAVEDAGQIIIFCNQNPVHAIR